MVNVHPQEMRFSSFRKSYLLIVFLIFTGGFFYFPVIKWHCNFFYIFILLPYILTIRFSNIAEIISSRIFRLLLVLVGYLALTLLWSDTGHDLIDYLRVGPNLLSLLVFLCVTIELTLAYKNFSEWLFKFLGWSSLLAALVYIYISDYHFIYPPIRLRQIGVSPSSIQLGCVYGAIMLMVYYNVIKKDTSWKMLYVLISISALTILTLTQSRGPIVGIIAAFFIGSIMCKDKFMLWLISCVLTGVAILTYFGNSFLQGMIIVRGFSYRLEIWPCAFLKIREKIIFGHGLLEKLSCLVSDGGNVTRAHNLYISTLFYGGLLGLFLIIVLIITTGWQGWLYNLFERNCIYLVWLIYGSICVITGYDQIIYRPHPVYIFFWLPFGFLAAYEIKIRRTFVQTDNIIKQDEVVGS